MTVERNGEPFDTGAHVSGGSFGLNYNSVEERSDTDTVEFYTDVLDFDETLWNFSRVEDNGGRPTLII